MDQKELIRYIKDDGCRVRMYRNKKYVNGAFGTFWIADAGPIISIATRGESRKKITNTLLHEYGHYLQWKDGFSDAVEAICDPNITHWEWVRHKIELSKREWKSARNAHLTLEWDAEVRGLNLAEELEIRPFDRDFYLRGAYGYMISIKWSWAYRKNWKRSVQHKYSKPIMLDSETLYAPLTKKERKLCRNIRV